MLIKDSEFYKLKTYKGSKINNIEENESREVKEIRQNDTSNKQIKLFFSYSHKDEELRDELEKHLIMLKRQGVISTWYDRKIDAGSVLDKEIDDNLKDSNIILLLVSVDFLVSDYCYEIEMKEALKMHENKQAVIVPVILRNCDWTSAPFSKLMALPTDGKSITTWADKDSAFLNVAKGIKNIATKL
ncbi:toll/interleukin-1 receptor domain-containing protein [Clostridium botulinum]|uniref:Toll/interleukin-1 receptor domain-containing protein n=1 Tax=Clostridium botulinum TaxID=1491 RepID=A0A6M0SSJ0_CLOBO|nr:toll/interleukin-1 receptor domain-containing protein [Clostridium botulinum]